MKLLNIIFNQKELKIRNKTIVCIGGGTGLFSLLSGLKHEVSNEKIIKVIVSTLDNGGSSGKLITQYGVLPPGDIRNCIVALSKETKVLNDLFQYRFDEKLKNHNFGNLLITALTKIIGDFNLAVKEASKILRIKGEIIPVSLEKNDLVGFFDDGTKIVGESQISNAGKKIIDIKLKNKSNPNKRTLEVLKNADIIIFGPGSLYTSIIPNLLFPQIRTTIKNNKKAKKILITSVMSQPGETDNYTVSDFRRVVEKFLGSKLTHILVNTNIPLGTALKNYQKENKYPTILDKENIKGIKLILANLIDENKIIRHDPNKLAKIIKKII